MIRGFAERLSIILTLIPTLTMRTVIGTIILTILECTLEEEAEQRVEGRETLDTGEVNLQEMDLVEGVHRWAQRALLHLHPVLVALVPEAQRVSGQVMSVAEVGAVTHQVQVETLHLSR